jgi:hypothetical protein
VATVEDYLSGFTQGRVRPVPWRSDQADQADQGGAVGVTGEANGETGLSTGAVGHDVGVHLVLTRGEAVLLGRRANTGFADGSWHVPGGRLEPGETLPQAAVREAAEELGIGVDPRDLRVACVCHHLDPDVLPRHEVDG